MAPCDRRLLGQALTNLLQNAADGIAMRPGRTRTRRHGRRRRAGPSGVDRGREREIRLSVGDDGAGLPADDRQRLTEPYVTHKPKGTGLGLAIVKKIMEDHGGSVMLDDRAGGATGRSPR